MDKEVKVTCPTCRKKGTWFKGNFGPFCSKQCKWVDLGKWLEGEMVISDDLRPDLFRGYGDLPPGGYLDDPDLDPMQGR